MMEPQRPEIVTAVNLVCLCTIRFEERHMVGGGCLKSCLYSSLLGHRHFSLDQEGVGDDKVPGALFMV